jgi:hypothetical protein
LYDPYVIFLFKQTSSLSSGHELNRSEELSFLDYVPVKNPKIPLELWVAQDYLKTRGLTELNVTTTESEVRVRVRVRNVTTIKSEVDVFWYILGLLCYHYLLHVYFPYIACACVLSRTESVLRRLDLLYDPYVVIY